MINKGDSKFSKDPVCCNNGSSYVENYTAQSKVKQHIAHKSAVWNLWSKPNP